MTNAFHDYPITEILVHYSLGELLDYKLITANAKHVCFLLVTMEGLFKLTVVTNMSLAEVDNRLRFTHFLYSHTVPCPKITLTNTKEYCMSYSEYVVFVNEWLLGEPIFEGNAKQCEALGKLFGQVHNLSTNFTNGSHISKPIANLSPQIEKLLDILPIHEALLIQEELGFQHLELREMLPRGIVHGNLVASKILFSGDFILGLLGYYQAYYDAFLLDLAFLVNHWCCDIKGHTHAKNIEILLHNYQSHRPFTPLETQHWAAMRRAAALHIWLDELTQQLDQGQTFIVETPALLKQKNILLELSTIPKF